MFSDFLFLATKRELLEVQLEHEMTLAMSSKSGGSFTTPVRIEVSKLENSQILDFIWKFVNLERRSAFELNHVAIVLEGQENKHGREALQYLINDLVSIDAMNPFGANLFMPSKNSRNNVGTYRDFHVMVGSSLLRRFEAFGYVLRIALMSKVKLSKLRLSQVFWKQLVGQTPTKEDLATIDHMRANTDPEEHIAEMIARNRRAIDAIRRGFVEPNLLGLFRAHQLAKLLQA